MIAFYIFGVNIATYLIVKYVLCSDLLRSLDDPKIKKDFWPFYRDELKRVSIIWSFPHYVFFWPRFLLGWSMLIIMFFFLIFLLIGVEDPENLDPIRAQIIKFCAKMICRVGLALIGYPFIEFKKAEICYKKYLGPDWIPEWSGASTLVCNHSAWYDGAISIYHYYPAMSVLETLKWYPFAGKFLMAINTVFIKRVG